MKKPIYYIACHIWNDKIEDYDFTVYCQGTNIDSIRKTFNSLELTQDMPLIELYLQGEDTDERLAYKEY